MGNIEKVEDIINVIDNTLKMNDENNKSFQDRFKERKKGDHSIIEHFQDQLARNLSKRFGNTRQNYGKEYALFGNIENWETIKDRADISIEKIKFYRNRLKSVPAYQKSVLNASAHT